MIMSMSAKICRKLSPKTFALTAVALTIVLCLYYASNATDSRASRPPEGAAKPAAGEARKTGPERIYQTLSKLLTAERRQREEFRVCPKLEPAEADVNTVEVFKEFEFQPAWMKSKEYWDKSFEDRYERQKMDTGRPPLKVIIVPHSHNDPGWLKTFENYFHFASRQIMNHMVVKLQQYKNLTFIWSEMAFLNAWWEEAHPSKRRALKRLVQSGRLEITTGGWVMTDEANAHVYAMVDQLIEGHQWAWTNLGVKPKTGWSVDPFGHGSTQPYLLAASGVRGAVIQRIHYAWKQWLAHKQYGDFRWVPAWEPAAHASLLTHNQPFDIYSIKHSCGPHPYVCLNFDFRKVPGEYTEYSIKAQTITAKNVREKSELLLEQYARTGSLLPHNVVLMPLGDDFRYNVADEWDQQYTNYMKLIEYINANRETYQTEIGFGTPSDYFEAIVKRYDQYPTLKGDFFVYSDIFSEGRPAYWSGYYTTRPFMKILDRQLEASLRGAELLYTLALNHARQTARLPHVKILERDFERLVRARRHLALFQHHDAITGTSKSFVMRDYGLKLFEGLRDTAAVQQTALRSLFLPAGAPPSDGLVLSDTERDAYDKLPRRTVLCLAAGDARHVLLYNSLAQTNEQPVRLVVNTTSVRVRDEAGAPLAHQLNPVWDAAQMVADEYELVFVARLAPLSVTAYRLEFAADGAPKLATIYCNRCAPPDRSPFAVRPIPAGDIQLENHRLKLLFNGLSGLLKTVTRKHAPRIMQCGIQFAAYRSAQFHSGAYLFMPDPNERETERDVLQGYRDQLRLVIASGAVASEVGALYGAFLQHTATIYHLGETLPDAIHVENTVDFEPPPKNRETELFMRVVSDVQNGEPSEFYTDQNGFQMVRRVKVEKIGVEGNYYPITTMAFIQDERVRLSLLTDHAQGAASWQPGFLEVMLDRRTLYDDSRGMGEGLVDNRRTVHRLRLLIEDVAGAGGAAEGERRFEAEGEGLRAFNVLPTEGAPNLRPEAYVRPSLWANRVSNALIYPVGVFFVEGALRTGEGPVRRLVEGEFPCDLHLMTLRTQPDAVYAQFPAVSALMVLHRQGYDCTVGGNYTCGVVKLESKFGLGVGVQGIEAMMLTGVEGEGGKVGALSDIYVEAMSLKTFNVTFG